MIKNRKAFAFPAIASILSVGALVPSVNVFAAASCEASESIVDGLVTNAEDLQYAIRNGVSEIKVANDFVVNCQPDIMTESLKIDLNGKKIEANVPWALDIETSDKTLTIEDSANGGVIDFNDAGIWVEGGANLTINSGTVRVAAGRGRGIVFRDGKLTIAGGLIETENGVTGNAYYPTIVALNDKTENLSIDITGGEIKASNGTALSINGGEVTLSDAVVHGGDTGIMLDDGARLTMSSGVVDAFTWVVTVFDNSEFVMNGGELNTTGPNSIGIAGNGTADPNSANYGGNAKLTLNAGTINSNDLGVYAPQVDGITTLGKDLTINAKKCGVEIRAGELNVDGATINVDADAEYVFNPNGSGSTASGVAIAVAQHTTTMPISANVNDGKFTAPVAFAESNPQKNEEEDIAKVSLLITGGEFDATNGKPVVASEDVIKFIQGGTFNKEVETKYIAEGYDLYDLSQDGPWIVDEATTVILPERVFLQVGETYEVELSDIAKKYGTFGLSEKIATVDENIITATEVGTSVVNFQLHNYNEPLDENFELIVYSVMPADEDALDDEEEKDEVAQYATEQIAELIETGESSNENIILYDESDKNGVEVLKERLVSGDEIITEVVSESYDDEEMYGQADTYEEIKEVLGDDQILKMFDVRVLIKTSNGATLGQIVNLNTPKTISVELNEDDLTAPEGYSRNYYVIRGHQTINGEKVAEKIEATLEGNILSFESDKFSTFAVAYVDTETPVDPTDEPVEPVVDPTDEPVEPTDEPVEAEAPNTGTVTTAGASAISAAFMTAIMTGVITMIMAFMVMMKKR